MPSRRTTLSDFLAEDPRCAGEAGSDLRSLLTDVQAACRLIATAASYGVLARPDLSVDTRATGINFDGDRQHSLDMVANAIMVSACEAGGQLAGMVSEEFDEPYHVADPHPRGRYLLVFDPLDGSSNIEVNVPVGTIFSVLHCPEGIEQPAAADFLQPGTRQVAAGYAIYGHVTMLVLTLGAGVHGFTLDPDTDSFILTHPDIAIPAATREFAVNVSNERFWEPPVRRYVEECLEGVTGPRNADFNMRWIASMVAEVHRILMRGGLFMYPRDLKDPKRQGRLRLLYEANPMAMLVEQAGGAASTGRQRLMEVVPSSIHQRVAVILGSREEVERLDRYHAEHVDGTDNMLFKTPLFQIRSLFRTA